MPCSAKVARWSGRSRRASNPPWIAGCNVLTRPSSISGEPDQDGGAGNCESGNRPAVFGDPATAYQHNIRRDDALDDGGMAKAALHRALVEMPAMRLPDAFAAREAAQQCDRRIGEKIER